MTGFRVVVIGGTGAFGEKVARLLAGDSTVVVIVAARTIRRAEAVAAALRARHGRDDVVGATLDLDAPAWREALAGLRPHAVIHTAGPFQNADYRVAEACIEGGIHYIDLADGRDFVCGIAALDAAAQAAAVLVASGASSVPAFSSAVVDGLAKGLSRIDAIDIGITPGNRAPRGLATIAAILSYVGRPLRLWRAGAWTQATGWQDLHRRTLALPDGARLGRRWFALCDVPDLALFPARYGVRRHVLFHAGLELSLLHLGLWLLSWPVRWRWLASLAPFAPAMRWLADLVRALGTDRGGMLVDVAGVDADGRAVTRRFRLLAEAGDGPWMPALASVALARKLARGTVSARGAMPCMGLLTREDILAEARHLAIRSDGDEVRPLYPRVIGAAYAMLPPAIARLHDLAGGAVWRGRADIDGARGPLAWLARHLFRFPAPASAVPVTVAFEVRDGIETWQRDFGTHRFTTRQHAGSRQDEGMIVERFGAVSMVMQAIATSAGIDLKLRRGRLAGLPLPLFLLPRIAATERVDNEGRFRFDVAVDLPVIGRLVHYCGWLESADQP